MTRNLLGSETSPYLLQHRDNPVHWRPWGAQALAEAARDDKPILLSVGYAACHWCHVMAHESFEDAETARLMNELFINVKVDREERPDIDQIYMNALQLFGEQGGWPMTMFLTPAGEPYWGGTYFPPEPRWGRPSFPQVMTEVARLYREERHNVDHNREVVTRNLKAIAASGAGDPLEMSDVNAAADGLANLIDPTLGGLQGAPKFPQFAIFELIARAGLRRDDAQMQQLFLTTMDRIFEGGIYDHLGGGLARYSTDGRWLVPHFEKMLYDNGRALSALALAWQMSRRPLFQRRIEEIMEWLDTEMLTGDGAYAASLDADSEGEEGRFYVWSRDDIANVLGTEDAQFFSGIYDATEGGNWEGKTVFNRLVSAPGIDDETERRLAPLRAKLLKERESRIRPGLDDKVLTDWNGLAISGLARAGMTLERPEWIGRAASVFRYVADSDAPGVKLLHSRRGQQRGAAALAADYANMAAAALDLHEATGEANYIERASAWMAILETEYTDGTGGFYMTPQGADDLIIRPRSAADDPTPNANGVALDVYVRLECFTGNTEYGAKAAAVGAAFAGLARKHAFGHATLLNAAERAMTPMQVVVVGNDRTALELAQTARTAGPPTACITVVKSPEALPNDHPARIGRREDTAAAYVCTGRTCSLPVKTPAALEILMAESYRTQDSPA